MTTTSCPYSSTSDFLRSNDNRVLVNILFYFSEMRDSLKKKRRDAPIGTPLYHPVLIGVRQVFLPRELYTLWA